MNHLGIISFFISIILLQTKFWVHAKYLTRRDGKRFRGIFSITPLDKAFWVAGYTILFPILTPNHDVELNNLKSKVNRRLTISFLFFIVYLVL